MRSLRALFFISLFVPAVSAGQETGYGPGYQVMLMSNPGFAGSGHDGNLRLFYLNFYPGKNYNLNSVFVSYDSYFPSIHGGAGFYLSDDYLGGIVNDLKGGLSYAYFLKAGGDFFINAGLSASFFHRGFSFSHALLPDQIDPLGGRNLPAGESLAGQSRSVFDIGAGFIFIKGKIAGGLSVSHLAEPDISISSGTGEKLYRKLVMHLSGDYDINVENGTKIRPLAYLEVQDRFFYGGPGVVFESSFLSINMLVLGSSYHSFDMQAGFSLNMGRMTAFYNYRFNILSPDNMLPFSLVLQTGLSYSLNNVDKRKNAMAIIFPKL